MRQKALFTARGIVINNTNGVGAKLLTEGLITARQRICQQFAVSKWAVMSRVINREDGPLLITIPLVAETDVDSIALSTTGRIYQGRRIIRFCRFQNTIRPSTIPLVMSLIHRISISTDSLYRS